MDIYAFHRSTHRSVDPYLPQDQRFTPQFHG